MPEVTACTTPDDARCPHMKTVQPTAAGLQAKIDAVLAEFPALKAYDPAGACCSGCVQSDVGRGLGWDAADAWEELQGYYFYQMPKSERQ
jgi:hypothetical protein